MKKVIFFSLRDKNMYRACKIYQGDCIYRDNYTGETKLNVTTKRYVHVGVNIITPTHYS